VWSGQDLVTIIGMLSDTLREEGYGHVKIFAPETMTSHMYPGGTGDYVKMIMADEKAAAAIGAYATHGYEDGVKEEMSANSSRVFWNLIKDTGKPFWITEGGTGGHDWPVPIQKGVALAIHNALVAGNCSAFVPWQISERDRSTHALMHMSQYTPKTFAAMHYTKFVKPGAERVEAEPGFSPVMTGAFHHAKDGVLSLVIINSTNAEQPLNIVFENISGLKTMKQYRTSATENLKEIGEVKVENGKAALDIPALSMITLTGETDKQAEPAQKQPE
jgi:O-glycosyl hydrolase